MCSDGIDENINLSVPWYLMAAYAYYIEDEPILSDAQFDRLVRKMINKWDKINHMHKHLITTDMLEAGSYLGEYPSRVQGAVAQVRKANG